MCFSHYFIYIPLTDKINRNIYKQSFIENLAALKYSMSTERRLDRTEQFFIYFTFSHLADAFIQSDLQIRKSN